MTSIIESYVKSAPSNQNMVDIFKGEWSSMLPSDLGVNAAPGRAALFSDPRISWLSSQISSFKDKSVLELGPLEAGHTYMIHREDPARILAVEANNRSFLKCLIVKELCALSKAEFRFGDAMEYMRTTYERHDVCIASGILYHSTDPAQFLQLCARVSSSLYLWTHYYERDVVTKLPGAEIMFTPWEIQGKDRMLFGAKRQYGASLDWAGFCGGSEAFAYWLDKPSLFQAIEDAGFRKVQVDLDSPNHPNGPSISLLAKI